VAYLDAYGEMMSVGPFDFGLTSAAYNALNRKQSWRWTKVERLGVKPASQFIGPDAGEMTFKGIIYAELQVGAAIVGTHVMDRMRAVADQGTPLYVIDGRGYVYGRWVITSVEEDQSVFVSHGAARKQEFTVSLQEYGGASATGFTNFTGGFDVAIGALSGFNALGIVADVATSAVLDLVGDAFGDSPIGELLGD
jgi:phage protein U